MAVVEELAQPPRQDEGEPADPIVLETSVRRGEEAHKGLSDDKYHLIAPVFTGNEDIEKFIQKFSDVVAVTQWLPHVALLQLRLALADKAKPYGLGPRCQGHLCCIPDLIQPL